MKYTVTWQAEDVQSLKPDWTLEQSEQFLSEHFNKISERMTELGWEVIGYYLKEFGGNND